MDLPPLRLVMLGNGPFAVPTLAALADSGHEVAAAHIRWDTVRDTAGEASGSGLSDLGPPHRGILFDRRARDLAGILWARAGRRIRRGGSTPMA